MSDAYRDLDPEQAQQEIEQDPSVRLLDVRTEPEHQSHRLPNATLVPIQELQQRVDELDPDENWFVYCEHGVRSVAACRFLAANGFEKVTNIRGGMAHWAGKGLPYERGR